MIVQNGRHGGHTTQMFIDILADNKNTIVRCRTPRYLCQMFTNLFGPLIDSQFEHKLILIDGRTIKFIPMSDETNFMPIGEEWVGKTDI